MRSGIAWAFWYLGYVFTRTSWALMPEKSAEAPPGGGATWANGPLPLPLSLARVLADDPSHYVTRVVVGD